MGELENSLLHKCYAPKLFHEKSSRKNVSKRLHWNFVKLSDIYFFNVDKMIYGTFEIIGLSCYILMIHSFNQILSEVRNFGKKL